MFESLTGTDLGVIVFAVAFLLGKIAEFILRIRNGGKLPDVKCDITPGQQSDLCKEHHRELLGAIKEHKAAAALLYASADGLLRANSAALQEIKTSILNLQGLEKSVKKILEDWKLEYNTIVKIIETNNTMISTNATGIDTLLKTAKKVLGTVEKTLPIKK